MKKLLIVYHSLTGGSAQMAQAAAAGAASSTGVAVQLKSASQTAPEHLLAADGYLFACPENLASMAGLMKDFFDRCYYPVLDRLNGRPYAVMICAGSDGSNAARQIERIATGWRLEQIAPTIIVCTHAQTPERILQAKQIGSEDLAQCRELGATMSSGLEMGIF
jgi:multimeric flavodoxin WrbA